MSTEKGARRSRFVSGTVSTRAVKLDGNSEGNLRTISAILDGPSPNPVERVSFSMICRAALGAYASSLLSLRDNPHQVLAVRDEVIQRTVLPRVGRVRKSSQDREQARIDLAQAWEREAARQHAQGPTMAI